MIGFATCCNSQGSKSLFITTTKPAALILQEIVGIKGEVTYLLPPAASPHTYEPKPSDIAKAFRASALFMFSKNLDGWAASIPVKNRIELFSMLPDSLKLSLTEAHNHDSENPDISKVKSDVSFDPHFWTDPVMVKQTVPALRDTLIKLDPANAEIYKSNAETFIKKLDVLNVRLMNMTVDIRGKSVFLNHPSLIYFLERYGLIYAGSFEEIPGKEPSPKYLAELSDRIKSSGVNCIFNEPQLPDKMIRNVAESLGIAIYTVDPIGTSANVNSYSDLLVEIAKKFSIALK